MRNFLLYCNGAGPSTFLLRAYTGGALFNHVRPDMRIYREEIFGPVLCCVRVKNFAEAVKLWNCFMCCPAHLGGVAYSSEARFPEHARGHSRRAPERGMNNKIMGWPLSWIRTLIVRRDREPRRG
jgi:acyl-CoA reductase-like NAD-dependent aldehyde dehydrogenase